MYIIWFSIIQYKYIMMLFHLCFTLQCNHNYDFSYKVISVMISVTTIWFTLRHHFCYCHNQFIHCLCFDPAFGGSGNIKDSSTRMRTRWHYFTDFFITNQNIHYFTHCDVTLFKIPIVRYIFVHNIFVNSLINNIHRQTWLTPSARCFSLGDKYHITLYKNILLFIANEFKTLCDWMAHWINMADILKFTYWGIWTYICASKTITRIKNAFRRTNYSGHSTCLEFMEMEDT